MLWKTQAEGRTLYLQITPAEVVLGYIDGRTLVPAAGRAHQGFREGELQAQVERYFGAAVLSEVLAQLSALPGATPEAAPEGTHLDRLAIRPELWGLREGAALENGFRHLGNGGRGRTNLRGEASALMLDGPRGRLVHHGAREETFILSLDATPSAALVAGEHFFLIVMGHPLVVTPEGALWRPSLQPDFEALVAYNLFRAHAEGEDRVLVAYRWRDARRPEGVLELRPEVGFVGHALKS